MIIEEKIMKYVIFKRRTEKEVRQKCQKLQYTDEYIDEIIGYLSENNYINDEEYVGKYIHNVMKLKNASIFEMKMDLLRRGIDEVYIEKYINNNYEELQEFEEQSAQKLAKKKSATAEIDKVRKYLISKGYKYDSIALAIDNCKELQDND